MAYPSASKPGSDAPRAAARDWRRDALVALAVCAVATAVFAGGALDLGAAALFYDAHAQEHWPLGSRMPWSLLYRMAPWITASLVLGGLAALVAGVWRRHSGLRRHGTFVLAVLVIGPGILVNGVFKDHWNRPRPRDVVQFSGAAQYAAAPLPGEAGKSFPCGHCSVGFLYGLGWWIWSGTRPLLAAASAGIGLALGVALGIGRMAAGGHFASDIVWSALIPFLIAHVLYHYVPGMPGNARLAPSAVLPRGLWRFMPLAAGSGAVAVLAAVFLTAHGTPIATRIPVDRFAQPPRVFEVVAPTANVNIVVVDAGEPEVAVAGELHGFGLPGSRLATATSFDAMAGPKLTYAIEQSGWFTDLDANLSLRVPANRFERIVVRLGRGNVALKDATRGGVVGSGKLRLDLNTGGGRVDVR